MTSDHIPKFLKTIYLGDRACQGYALESWKEVFRIYINEISRIRSSTGHWEYYNDENIAGGAIVFAGVQSVKFSPTGPIPNDYVEIISAERAPDFEGAWKVRFEIGCGLGSGAPEVIPLTLEVIATDVYLESPERPGEQIR